ncbi:hypothetical protein M011DRAFT_117415 [Sporormia fimetaria CBS 119925]|uniref:Uncharacterized protein n=1 Tax=Sporormia fimetaria CBS 119925 TaxID=1340428 RepID=A0A6A6VQM1_9PLEO|nr:hypothetical protein M011DRAFT_117415 [Sporormia fimetaria CBS 119925]
MALDFSATSQFLDDPPEATGTPPSHNAIMDYILPNSKSKSGRRLPATPKMERSMTDSFMSDSGYIPPRSPQPLDLVEEEPSDSGQTLLPPLSSLAHLSLVKNQRNSLLVKLDAQRIASAEAKASASALRRLALRLAVNISVKEKQIAETAKKLANSRTSDYKASRKAEKRIQNLTESLREEERKSRDILDTLEKVSAFTLQCNAQCETT